MGGVLQYVEIVTDTTIGSTRWDLILGFSTTTLINYNGGTLCSSRLLKK